MDDKCEKDQICIQKDADEEEEDWSVSCSDDEKYNNTSNKSKVMWEPKPEEIVELYKVLSEKGILEIEWKCPGRRSPSPPPSNATLQDDSGDENQMDEQKNVAESTEFEFDDDMAPTTALKPRRSLGHAKLRGSGQKRTASLQNVVSEIIRHRKLENQK
uniref:PAXIP1-associated glutamate-rich protein 1 n=1 Tax=Strigamia maritima TaxID=126957 RepID=T1INR3_STRMM